MELLNKCLTNLKEKGADKSEVYLTKEIKQEMNIHSGEIKLLRTLEEYNLEMSAIIDDKKDTIKLSEIDDQSIEEAASEVIENAKNSQPDEANDISENALQKEFQDDKTDVDIELMHERLHNFIQKVDQEFPDVIIEEAILVYNDRYDYYSNSNGVNLTSNSDNYSFFVMFFAKKEQKTSSFNYTFTCTKDLDKEILELGSLSYLLEQSIEHLEPKNLENKKITGDVIITPDCMNELLSFVLAHLQNHYLISGISKFQDRIDEKVIDDKFTLRTEPDSGVLADKNYFGKDGIVNENDYIFENGVLKNYLLDLYGSKKTGFDRGPSTGVNLVMENGERSFEEMIESVDQGIVLSRFSGGAPAPNGDFSGVAKNSYYIEDGKIKYPIKETMVSGNLFDMLQNIKGISKERINNGESLLPYVQFQNVTISSK
ncbi:TldD/PmbA family protein [Natranaerobius thermophilus]|uniref:Peptidase U62 modulator of DNA gyrase n=1 Tax=Natranaerobius thermophilus (strain ATCC BAA-1301 / DSM 18059 / JW/NM-WN-LF) TaxID=457570 RepID=B2A600_NATTJ|nr:TldD/PmbA family protein [Natranaerobius thermophilus]ACB85417.1 peptidase U62 modulator of DNA gyrase [Natranaerobius thermophilus JW/NM-WN-LF]